MRKMRIMVLAVLLSLTALLFACGGQEKSAASIRPYPNEGDQKELLSLINETADESVVLQYDGGPDITKVTFGYELYEKGEMTGGEQEGTTDFIEGGQKGLLSVWFLGKHGKTVVTFSDGAGSVGIDAPWAKDGESYTTGSSALGSPADIKKGEKIYIYAHYADTGDVTVPGTLPDLPSEEELAANDKSYFFYVIFE